MKIALLAHAGSVHTRRWATGLISRGYDVRLLSNVSAMGYPEDVRTDILPGHGTLAYFWNIPRVRSILRHCQPDIVHAHYATGFGLWGFMQKRAPLVVSVWGTDIADALAGKFGVTVIVRKALKTARVITSSSKYLLEQTARFEPSVAARLMHIPFGVTIPAVNNEKGGTSDKPLKIIFPKQFTPTYNPEITLTAFAGACRQFPDMELVMLGGGPLRDRLVELTKKYGIEDRVEIRGWVAMNEAESLIRQSDIMVMPSNQESFGVAALEASAAGIPVIATNVGGIPEVVEDGVTGILISPGDQDALTEAIVRLAENGELRQKMGAAGREMVKARYDFNHCLDRMEELYHKVLGD